MILKKIFNILLSFFDSIIPEIDQSSALITLVDVFDSVMPVLTNGISILRMFLGSEALYMLSIFLSLIVVLNFVYLMYSVVMWVMSKIPFLGIK